MFYSRILSVVTAASDPMLVSLATAKDELDITDNTLDFRLTRWIKEASSEITGYIGRPLRLETVTETLRTDAWRPDAPGEHFYPRDSLYGVSLAGLLPVAGLALRRYPIASVTAITEDGIALDPTSEFEIDSEYGIIYRLSGSVRTPWCSALIQITYAGGYATADDVPGDIQKACLLALKHRRAAQTRDPMLRRVSTPGVLEQEWTTGSGKSATGLPTEAIDVIDHYRDVHA